MPADRDASADNVSELVRRCLAGEAPAITTFVERFHRAVYALCYRMLGHRQDAEDVAQESLLRALRSLRNWDSRRDMAPWLLAIAGNRCRTMLAARARRLRTASDVRFVADKTPPPETVRQLAEEVARALRGIRPEYRQAFTLFHEQELSYQQIADALGCPLGTAKTWVHRARRELVEQLRARDIVPEHNRALRRV